MSNTAKNNIKDIIPNTQMTVTPTTLKWFETLYESGAIVFEPSGDIHLVPEIRQVMKAMHHILAGGDVQIQIERQGDSTFTKLEELFEQAMKEANQANKLRDPRAETVPYIP